MSAAIQLVFLMDGFNAAYRNLKSREADTGERLYGQHADTHSGYIGIVCDMVDYAYTVQAILDEYILANYFDDIAYPGVFEYEVTEELGKWLFEHPEVFRGDDVSEVFIDHATKSVAAWFNPVPEGTQPEKAL